MAHKGGGGGGGRKNGGRNKGGRGNGGRGSGGRGNGGRGNGGRGNGGRDKPPRGQGGRDKPPRGQGGRDKPPRGDGRDKPPRGDGRDNDPDTTLETQAIIVIREEQPPVEIPDEAPPEEIPFEQDTQDKPDESSVKAPVVPNIYDQQDGVSQEDIQIEPDTQDQPDKASVEVAAVANIYNEAPKESKNKPDVPVPKSELDFPCKDDEISCQERYKAYVNSIELEPQRAGAPAPIKKEDLVLTNDGQFMTGAPQQLKLEQSKPQVAKLSEQTIILQTVEQQRLAEEPMEVQTFETNNNLPIIIGMGCLILLMAIIITTILCFRRRMLQEKQAIEEQVKPEGAKVIATPTFADVTPVKKINDADVVNEFRRLSLNSQHKSEGTSSIIMQQPQEEKDGTRPTSKITEGFTPLRDSSSIMVSATSLSGTNPSMKEQGFFCSEKDMQANQDSYAQVPNRESDFVSIKTDKTEKSEKVFEEAEEILDEEQSPSPNK